MKILTKEPETEKYLVLKLHNLPGNEVGLMVETMSGDWRWLLYFYEGADGKLHAIREKIVPHHDINGEPTNIPLGLSSDREVLVIDEIN